MSIQIADPGAGLTVDQCVLLMAIWKKVLEPGEGQTASQVFNELAELYAERCMIMTPHARSQLEQEEIRTKLLQGISTHVFDNVFANSRGIGQHRAKELEDLGNAIHREVHINVDLAVDMGQALIDIIQVRLMADLTARAKQALGLSYGIVTEAILRSREPIACGAVTHRMLPGLFREPDPDPHDQKPMHERQISEKFVDSDTPSDDKTSASRMGTNLRAGVPQPISPTDTQYLTPNQAKLITASWQSIKKSKDGNEQMIFSSLLNLHYDKLFEIYPEAKVYFENSFGKRMMALTGMLSHLVANVERYVKGSKVKNASTFASELKSLGKQHARDYSTFLHAYLAVGHAWMHVVKARHEGLNDEVLQAWAVVYGIVTEAMLRGVERIPPGLVAHCFCPDLIPFDYNAYKFTAETSEEVSIDGSDEEGSRPNFHRTLRGLVSSMNTRSTSDLASLPSSPTPSGQLSSSYDDLQYGTLKHPKGGTLRKKLKEQREKEERQREKEEKQKEKEEKEKLKETKRYIKPDGLRKSSGRTSDPPNPTQFEGSNGTASSISSPPIKQRQRTFTVGSWRSSRDDLAPIESEPSPPPPQETVKVLETKDNGTTQAKAIFRVAVEVDNTVVKKTAMATSDTTASNVVDKIMKGFDGTSASKFCLYKKDGGAPDGGPEFVQIKEDQLMLSMIRDAPFIELWIKTATVA
eukprot:comp20955_c1_seq1/m.28032 comp20955_c1_seq1/g.28032  ORF comp20955_c1_seq1/g.28032 comp20955_c1_seq1/m.28032 type:complete len:695 (-) comp20955_c1_seq1:64-2148(-)